LEPRGGADRVAANGDVPINWKLIPSVLAKEHGIPFYVASAVIDNHFAASDGSKIPH